MQINKKRAKALLENPDVDTTLIDEKIKEWEQLKGSEERAVESASVQNKAFGKMRRKKLKVS